MKTSILIVSYLKDRLYLELNLRSIEKFAKDFKEVVVLVPQEEYKSFADLPSKYPITLVYYFRNCPQAQWHLMHQLQKCRADSWCPECDFVLHTDSDCMFTETVYPTDYFEHGKPVMLYESYSKLPSGSPWRAVTSAVLKRPVDHEFMRRHPQVNPVGIYSALRDRIEELHGMGFDEFVMSRKPDFPWGFTEHNIIGAFAFNHTEWQHRYHWHDVSVDGTPKEKLIQFWSHSPIDKPQEISHGGRFTPKEFAEGILK